MDFNAENLKKVYSDDTSDKQKDILMGYLVEYIDKLCVECVSDRMSNVLSPRCRRRFLINIRILCGTSFEELPPKFCYSQVISNLQRFLEKKTTLYTPVDVLIYNNDFFEFFFPGIGKRLLGFCNEGKLKEANMLIQKSKVPAIYAKTRKEKPGLLKNILKRDKMIKEGSFIYDFDEHHFVIWFQNILFIADFKKGYAVCNAHRENIESMEVLNMLLPLWSEGKEFDLILVPDPNGELFIKITISLAKLVKLEEKMLHMKFGEITEQISPKFPHTTLNFNEKNDLEIVVEIDKNGNNTYDDINGLFNTVSTLSEVENINLLEEVKEK